VQCNVDRTRTEEVTCGPKNEAEQMAEIIPGICLTGQRKHDMVTEVVVCLTELLDSRVQLID
jgi:hypothetical protein